MAFRQIEARTVVADDSNQQQVSFDRSVSLKRTEDNEVYVGTLRIGAADSEATIALGTITTGYAISLYSDYPIRVRLNGASETQFVMTSSNTPVTNFGAPAPSNCCFVATVQVTSLRLQPINDAAQTATVHVAVTGDPTSAYV